MSSIKSRLAIGLGTSIALLVSALWWTTKNSINDLTDNYIRDRLEMEMESLLAELSLDDDDLLRLDHNRVDRMFHHAFSGHYFRVSLLGSQPPITVESRNLNGFNLGVPEVKAGETATFRTHGPKGELLFVLVKGFHIREKTLVVAVSNDLTPFEKDLDLFLLEFSVISMVWTAGIFLVSGSILHYSFLPLQKHRLNLKHWMESRQRLEMDEDVPLEIKPYIQSLNRLLQITVTRLERTRSALTSLSHAMKMPLTLLIQLAEHDAIRNDGEVYSVLTESTQRLLTLVDRQLKRARIIDPELTGGLFVFAWEIPPLVRTLQSLYYNKDVRMDVDFPDGLRLEGDRLDILEILGNLLENAFKWAETRVLLSAGSETGVWITIEDDGPGLDARKLQQIMESETRLDESASGHGVGLGIVREIVAQYGGQISFDRSGNLGGTKVHVRFPGVPTL